MLDNLFIGTLLAGLGTLAVVAATTPGATRPLDSRASLAQPHRGPLPAPGTGVAEVVVLPATAEAPMPVYQLPRVVVRGNVMREPALFAEGTPGAGRPAEAAPRAAAVQSR